MSDVRTLVERYLSERFGRPHPMPRGEKGPRIDGWQNPEKVFGPEVFGPEDNVGTALTNHLVDLDLDCSESVQLAPKYLAPTGRIAGRASKRASHYFYRIEGVDSYKFKDVPELDPKTNRKVQHTILEIRAGAKHQTMLPPSLHPSGERVEWAEPFGDTAEWNRDEVWQQARAIAAAVLLGRHWSRGGRHDAALAVGGYLAGRLVPLALAEQIQTDICALARDEETQDRVRAVRESYQSFAANNKTTGLPKIRELMGEDVAKRLGEWYRGEDDSRNHGRFKLTESGDADAFAAFGKDVLRFDFRRGAWLIIDRPSGIWIPDDVAKVTEFMKAFMRHQQNEANNPNEDVKDRKRVIAWYLDGESRSRINNALQLAKSVPPIANDGADWDTEPFLLGCQNGVVDLATGEFRPALPEEHVSKRVRIDFDPHAECPVWLRTLGDIFAPGPEFDEAESLELRLFLQRAVGYSITADCREECCFITWGGGGNGKGTIINTLGWILADYRDDMPYTTLEKNQHGSGIPNDVAKMFGRRFITCSEMNEFRLNENRLKSLTGRDPMTARFLNKEFFTFVPVGKIWMATNNRPKVVGTDDGIWRRIHLIPFLRSFKDHPDTTLKDRLMTLDEMRGILRWAVEGARMWLERGLDPPKTVRAATEEYRHESNPITPFVEARCVVAPECKVAANLAWKNYELWMNDVHIDHQFRLNQTQFHKHMKARFGETKEFRVPNRNQFYLGVGLREDRPNEPPPDNIPF